MTLTGMLRADKNAVICDLAETYGVLNYRALPVPLLAVLASGLRDDSRIKMSLSGAKATKGEILLAAAVDRLSYMVWGMTEDSRKGINRPESVLDAMLGNAGESGETVGFATAEEYESEWERITGVKHG